MGVKLRDSPGSTPLTPLRDSRGEFCPKSPKLGHPHPLQAVGVGDDFGGGGGGIEQRVGLECRKSVIRAGAVTLGMFARNFGI